MHIFVIGERVPAERAGCKQRDIQLKALLECYWRSRCSDAVQGKLTTLRRTSASLLLIRAELLRPLPSRSNEFRFVQVDGTTAVATECKE